MSDTTSYKYIMVVKVGSDERPASSEDIDYIVDKMEEVQKSIKAGEMPVLVTHHAIDFQMVLMDLNEEVTKYKVIGKKGKEEKE